MKPIYTLHLALGECTYSAFGMLTFLLVSHRCRSDRFLIEFGFGTRARSVRPSSLFGTCSCLVRTFVQERGRGEGRRKIQRKNEGPSTGTLLKYVSTAYFLLPLAKLLHLTNGPKKRRRMEGQRIQSIFFYSCDWRTGLRKNFRKIYDRK
jgi:hypothetical protein